MNQSAQCLTVIIYIYIYVYNNYYFYYLFYKDIWGLKNGALLTSKINHESYLNKIRSLFISKKEEVGDIIISELNQINKSLLVEREFINNPDITDREKVKRLLFLFQLDLIPGVNGQILEAKGMRDNKHERCVPAYAKYLGWSFVILINLGMIYYILLFALNQTEYR